MSAAFPSASASAARQPRRRWLRGVVWALLAGVIAFYSASLLVKQPRVAAALHRRLAASFGRPVEVGGFDVSLWGGPQLVAQSVTVADDPRFGHEYFLRAERLTAGVRWAALVRGRLEFDSVVLTRPSLNLVRTADGQWNLESWLPWPSTPATPPEPGPPAPVAAPRLGSVRIEGGRINFKRGVDKHAFAVVGVEGSVSQTSSGQWRVDVEGRPMRAGVVVQEPGTIRVQGSLGGTSARLRPASLVVNWDEASLSDALRLLTGSDHGARGEVAMEGRIASPVPESLRENPAGGLWGFEGVLRVSRVHRWDLPSRESDPAFNLGVEGEWWPLLARAEFERIVLESAATQIRGNGFAQWGRAPAGYAGREPAVTAQPDANFRFVSSGISLNDLFRWYPAFHPEVGGGLVVEGYAGIDAEVRGWPLRLERAVMATGGARLRGLASGGEASVLSAVLRYDRRRGRMELAPVTVRLGPRGAALPSATLRVGGTVTPGATWSLDTSVAAQAASASALMNTAASLGISPLHAWTQAGWQAEGLADIRLRYQGTLLPFAMRPQGSMRLRDASLRSPALPEPLRIANAAIELAPGERRITLQSARALGTTWNGTLRQRAGQPWEATLSADALDVLAVHGSLAPQLQPTGFLQRLAPGRSPVPSLAVVLPELRARGRISVAQLRFHSMILGQFRAGFVMDLSTPWSLRLSDASAGFFGGGISGTLEARATEAGNTVGAAYRANIRLRGVNLAALTAGTPRLRGYFTGTADAELALTATGANRAALLDSLAGEGTLEVRNGQANLLDLAASLRSSRAQRGTTAFARATGRLRIAERVLTFDELQLSARPARLSAPDWLVVGAADLSGSAIVLDMQIATDGEPLVQPNVRRGATPGSIAARREFRLRGPLNAIELTPRP